jgi:hypothetical protein
MFSWYQYQYSVPLTSQQSADFFVHFAKPCVIQNVEAKIIKPWHAQALRDLHPKQLFFAYDTPDDLKPLQEAGNLMLSAGFTTASHALRCYVLCAYPKDTMEKANIRMQQAMAAGFTPMAMAWRGKDGKRLPGWKQFQRKWARPALIHTKHNKQTGVK